MTTLADWSLRLRLAATLGAVVAVAGLLLGAIALTGSALFYQHGSEVPIPVTVAVLTAASLALVVLQAAYGYHRALDAVDAHELDGDVPRELEARVTRLAIAADVQPPTLALVESTEPNSFTVGNGRHATIVVTRGLIATLSGDELDAVLAHELAHLKNHDVTVATIVTTISAISETLFARERRLAGWIRASLALAPFTIVLLLIAIPVFMLSCALVLVSVAARAVLAVNAVCIGLHAQTREFAADRAAAELVGDPAALASALQTLDGGIAREDARLHASATLGIVPRPVLEAVPDHASTEPRVPTLFSADDPVLESHWSGPDRLPSRLLDRVGRALEWRPATHPPTEARIERLLELAGEQHAR